MVDVDDLMLSHSQLKKNKKYRKIVIAVESTVAKAIKLLVRKSEKNDKYYIFLFFVFVFCFFISLIQNKEEEKKNMFSVCAFTRNEELLLHTLSWQNENINLQFFVVIVADFVLRISFCFVLFLFISFSFFFLFLLKLTLFFVLSFLDMFLSFFSLCFLYPVTYSFYSFNFFTPFKVKIHFTWTFWFFAYLRHFLFSHFSRLAIFLRLLILLHHCRCYCRHRFTFFFSFFFFRKCSFESYSSFFVRTKVCFVFIWHFFFSVFSGAKICRWNSQK